MSFNNPMIHMIINFLVTEEIDHYRDYDKQRLENFYDALCGQGNVSDVDLTEILTKNQAKSVLKDLAVYVDRLYESVGGGVDKSDR